MKRQHHLLFPPFRLEPDNARLWRGSQLLPLRSKPFTVLRYLAEHSGRLVTKEELLKAVWLDTRVDEGILKRYIRDLREVLEDEAEKPQFIETVYGQGYRFIAPVTTAPSVGSSQLSVASQDKTRVKSSQRGTGNGELATSIVGRETEIAQLHQWFNTVLRGQRQIVFVTGEMGIGKTTLVDAFLAEVGEAEKQKAKGEGQKSENPLSPPHSFTLSPLLVARGQCIEHYSASEAYLPVLEALGRLCRAPEGEQLMAVLSQHAPTWLLQMPALLSGAELEEAQRRSVSATPERMLREIAQALEELTAETLLVLWLEDLHGSDYATLDLLAFLARRREPARLLVIGTYRPLAVRSGGHPLPTIQQELQVRGQCHELALEPLSEGAVAEYLESQCGVEVVRALPLQGLAHVLHQRTEGNPLFMVNIIETVLKQEELGSGIEAVSRSVPANIRHFIEQQVEQMKPEEREVLEAASVAGRECSAAAIAAGLEEKVEEIEQRCGSLARRGHFVRASGIEEWPDGTVATSYRFVHALYQEVLYEGVTAARQVNLHRRIGERIEQGYSGRAGEVAAELAMHYERGRDYERAVRYLHLAGETTIRRYAHREALAFFTKGIALLHTLPETPAQRQQELELYMALGPALSMSRGWADPEVERVYTRARELCQHVGDTLQLFSVLQGLWAFSIMRADYQTAQELGEQLLRLAQGTADPVLLPEAHQALGITLCFLGDLVAAQEHLEQGIALYDPQPHRVLTLLYGQDPRVVCFVMAAWVLWLHGYPDQALARGDKVLTLARQLSHPFSLETALFFCAIVSQHCRRQGQAALQWTEEAMALSAAQGFPLWLAIGMVLQGAMMVRQGQSATAIEQMRQGLAAFRVTGAENLQTYLLALLAEAYGAVGRPEEGLAVLADALGAVNKTGERFYEAELYRLKGQLTLQSQTSHRQVAHKSRTSPGRVTGKSKIADPRPLTPDPQAEACFHQAIAIAQRQGAKSLELRATISLARLWQQQGKKKQARQMLAEIYGWFTEGFDTRDLQEAKGLLGELA